MSNLDQTLKRLQQLDEEVSKITIEETSDTRVEFNYNITYIRTDPDGNKWFQVELYLRPKGDFDLSNIEKVIYVLHPTFNPPTVAVSNPQNGFLLKIESWGDFHAMALIKFKIDPTPKRLIKYLPIGIKTTL